MPNRDDSRMIFRKPVKQGCLNGRSFAAPIPPPAGDFLGLQGFVHNEVEYDLDVGEIGMARHINIAHGERGIIASWLQHEMTMETEDTLEHPVLRSSPPPSKPTAPSAVFTVFASEIWEGSSRKECLPRLSVRQVDGTRNRSEAQWNAHKF